MKVTLINYTQDAIDLLIYTKATRLTQGEDTLKAVAAMTEEQKDHQLHYIARSIPGSWEFINYTFQILDVTRAFTHQFVRTRTGSYAQQSMRVNQMEEFTYETGPSILESRLRKDTYDFCMGEIKHCYNQLIKEGALIEDARGILPTNIHTNIVAQFNLRSLADLVKKRWTERTQDEYRGVVEGMVGVVLEVHPWAEEFLLSNKVVICKELEHLISLEIIDREDVKLRAYKLIDLLRKD